MAVGSMVVCPSTCGSWLGDRKWGSPSDLLRHHPFRWHKLTSCHWVWGKSRGLHYDSPGLPLSRCFGLRNQASFGAFYVTPVGSSRLQSSAEANLGYSESKENERHNITSCHSLCPEVPSHSASLLSPCIILYNRMLNYLKCWLHLEETLGYLAWSADCRIFT